MSTKGRIWQKVAAGKLTAEPAPSATTIAPAKTIVVQGREEFAARLRELRVQAGSPSFRQLARLTNYSSSTLADATSGRRLPTEPVLKALVSACGADPAAWLDELSQLAANAAQPPPGPQLPGGLTKNQTGRRPRTPLAVAAGLAIFGAGAATGWALAPASATSGSQGAGVPALAGTPAPAPTSRVTDGTDPGTGHCKADARLVDRAPVMRGSQQIGALDLLYSPWCGAGWAMIYLYPGQPTMIGEVSVRAGDGRDSSFANPLVKQVDDYTDVIVPGHGGCLGAYGRVYQQGLPLMTASVPCEAPTFNPAHPAP
jgi:transcriptional regulator with XRE-family HTH domain